MGTRAEESAADLSTSGHRIAESNPNQRELDMTNIDPDVFYSEEHQAALKARYEAVHADIMKTKYATLQGDIDSGHVWTLEGKGVRKWVFQALRVGAALAPPMPLDDDGTGTGVAAYWQIDGVAMGSVEHAENYIAALKAEYKELSDAGILPPDPELEADE
jgi:hypothetical protein